MTESRGYSSRLVEHNKNAPATHPGVMLGRLCIAQDISVIDSPDFLIDTTFFADKQYTLNKWGNDGGYEFAPDISGNLNTTSNMNILKITISLS